MPKISVIVPVYNVEKYLNRCVDSILSQTFTDFELILVDDGSPDNSGKICDEYKEKDSRVVVIHKENGGVSAARNDGIKIAKGEYITFVDSDDYVKYKYLEELLHEDVDLVCQTAVEFDESGNIITIPYMDDKEEFFTNIENDIIEKILLNGRFNWTVCKIFRRDIIKNNKICFDIDVNIGEDTLFTVQYAKNANSILIESKANYCYIIYNSRKTLSNGNLEDDLNIYEESNKKICSIIYSDNEKKMWEVFCLRMYQIYYLIVKKEFIAMKFLLLEDYKKNIKILIKLQQNKYLRMCVEAFDFDFLDNDIKKLILCKNKYKLIVNYTYLQVKCVLKERLGR